MHVFPQFERLLWPHDRIKFSLIITGINQFEMDGLEMTAVIRDLKGPPVIVMTGNYSPDVRRKAFKNGAKAFLRKPFLWERIERAVHEAIAHGIYFVGPVETNS